MILYRFLVYHLESMVIVGMGLVGLLLDVSEKLPWKWISLFAGVLLFVLGLSY